MISYDDRNAGIYTDDASSTSLLDHLPAGVLVTEKYAFGIGIHDTLVVLNGR